MILAGGLTTISTAFSCLGDQDFKQCGTIRLLRPGGNVRLLFNVDSVIFYPFSLGTFASASLRHTLLDGSMSLRVYALFASNLHLPYFWIARSDVYSPDASVVVPPIRNGGREDSSGIRHASATVCLIARTARPYATTLIAWPHRYEERGAWLGMPGKHDINSRRPPRRTTSGHEPRC